MDDSREGVDPPADGRGDRFSRIEEIYHQALDQPEPERLAFLRRACGTDESLRREVERLLSFDRKAGDFMQSPALDAAAQALARKTQPDKSVDLTGQTFLHYKVIEKIGAGGMGVVYKALDTHLKRPVAIKVLPPERLSDPERRRRFIQEARAASALNHPNIVTIYDIDQSGGTEFIAMEYVPGKKLSQLIPRKGMRLAEALKYTVQIADALAATHAAGIVHRDLKPANVIVTDKGQVKLLDFGLAKLTETLERGEPETTETLEPRSEEGTILGTVAYMSPEQAEGKAVDARSDIFSFGSVLYEMVTGRRAFEGDSRISTLSAILHQEPKPVSTIASGIPTDLEKLIHRCLRKDPERRIQHMDDVKLALAELQEDMDSGDLQAPPVTTRRVISMRLVAALVAIVVLIPAAWYWLGLERPTEQSIPLVARPLTSYPGYEDSPSFSPDGDFVAFEWCRGYMGVNCDIYIKQIDIEPPSPLTTGPEQDRSPAWSPDGRHIAFLRDSSPTRTSLIVVPQRGGQERVLAELDTSRLGTLYGPYLAWTPDSKWLALPWPEPERGARGLFLVSAQTGEKRRLTAPPADGDCAPAFSPDGRTLAFQHQDPIGSDLYILHLEGDYAPKGEPERIAPGNPRCFGISWSPDGGEVVYSSGVWFSHGRITSLWRIAASKASKTRRLGLPSENASSPAISRKGNRMAYAVEKSDANIWRVDLRSPGEGPETPVPLISSTLADVHPAYSPDGRRVAFASTRSGNQEIWLCDSDGAHSMQLSSFGNGPARMPRWSPDGRRIVFAATSGGNQDIYSIDANGGVLQRLTTDPASDKWPWWSRDGQSIYFASTRSGWCEIWKMPASGGAAVQITPDGETRDVPQESPDGSSLYYLKGNTSPCSVWRMQVEGGQETRVLETVHCYAGYAVQRQGIYFFASREEGGRNTIYYREFLTGGIRKVLSLKRDVDNHIAVSPDARTILYTQLDQSGSDLMLVENFR